VLPIVILVVVALVGVTAAAIVAFTKLVDAARPTAPTGGIDLSTLHGNILFGSKRLEANQITCNFPDCNFELFTIHADGRALRQLTDSPVADFAGSVSRDGKRMVWSRALDESHWQLLSAPLPSGRDRVIMRSARRLTQPAFSPDGARVAFSEALPQAGSAIFVLDLVDGHVKNVSQPGAEGSRDFAASWSPDGSQIAFVRWRNDEPGRGHLMVVDVATGELRDLTGPTEPDSPAWSPDGTSIAYADGGRTADLFVIPATGGTSRRLTHLEGQELFPSWSPDGAYVVFGYYLDGANELCVVRTDGSDTTLLPTGGAQNSAPWWYR